MREAFDRWIPIARDSSQFSQTRRRARFLMACIGILQQRNRGDVLCEQKPLRACIKSSAASAMSDHFAFFLLKSWSEAHSTSRSMVIKSLSLAHHTPLPPDFPMPPPAPLGSHCVVFWPQFYIRRWSHWFHLGIDVSREVECQRRELPKP